MLDQRRDLELLFKKNFDEASHGNGYAMMYIADCFLYGWGTSQDYKIYKNWLNWAASSGVNRAYERLFYEALSVCDYQEVDRVSQNWLNKKEFDFVHDSCQETLKLYNSLSNKTVKDMLNAFAVTKCPAIWNKTIAMIHQFGYGVDMNPEKAAEVYNSEIDRELNQYDDEDILSAMAVVGMYDMRLIDEKFISPNLVKIVGRMNLAHIDNNCALWQIGYNGRAMIFSACLGNTESMKFLALDYVPRDDGSKIYASSYDAARWYICAVENGADDAPTLLGLAVAADYEHAKGADKIAFKAMKLAAEKGLIPAMRPLGDYYWNGCGVDKDYAVASFWWLEAAKNGDEEAINRVNEISNIGNGDYQTGVIILARHDGFSI